MRTSEGKIEYSKSRKKIALGNVKDVTYLHGRRSGQSSMLHQPICSHQALHPRLVARSLLEITRSEV
jgi:hypothetical protein